MHPSAHWQLRRTLSPSHICTVTNTYTHIYTLGALLKYACRQVPDATSWAEWLLDVPKEEIDIALSVTHTHTHFNYSTNKHICTHCSDAQTQKDKNISTEICLFLNLLLSHLVFYLSVCPWQPSDLAENDGSFDVEAVCLCVCVLLGFISQKFYPPWGFHSSSLSLWGSCEKNEQADSEGGNWWEKKNERRQWDKKRDRERGRERAGGSECEEKRRSDSG